MASNRFYIFCHLLTNIWSYLYNSPCHQLIGYIYIDSLVMLCQLLQGHIALKQVKTGVFIIQNVYSVVYTYQYHSDTTVMVCSTF